MVEKLETILSRGTTTTRMRDYYDIYILLHLFGRDINEELLKRDFQETAQYRGSFNNIKTNGFEYIYMIEASEVLAKRWEQYRSNNAYVSKVEWSEALGSVKKIFEKIQVD